MGLKENFLDLKDKVLGGKLLDAFEEYYSDDVVMEDNDQEPRKGKEANRQYEQQFVEYVEQWNDGRVTAYAVNEDDGVVLSEWYMDVTFKDGNRMQRSQASVQHWKDGKIVHEKFYYPNS